MRARWPLLLPALFLGLASLAACGPLPLEDPEELVNVDEGGLGKADGSQGAYPEGRRHSPLTAPIVARLKAVLARSPGRTDVFSKIGDSITVNPGFLGCLAGRPLSEGEVEALEPTRARFDRVRMGGRTSFDRVSLSATVGWPARKALTGDPTPLDLELDASHAAFAVVMFGTNDTYAGTDAQFQRALRAIVARLVARGVVPILSTIPPRGDRADADALVPHMNDMIREIAAAAQVPLVDLWGALAPLPRYGLAGDGVHPQGAPAGSCRFDADAMRYGVNQRNLLTLEALDRVVRFVVGDEAPEPALP